MTQALLHEGTELYKLILVDSKRKKIMKAPDKLNRQAQKNQCPYVMRMPLPPTASHRRSPSMNQPVQESGEKLPKEFTVQMLRQEAAHHAKRGNYPQAISLLTQVINSILSGRTAMDYNNRGLMYFHSGQLEEAIADYNRALEINPNLAAAYNNRANCYVNQGELVDALVDYDRALDLNPFHLRALINQGVTFRHLGMYREALDNFDIALAQGKLEAYIYAQRGRTHHLAGDWNWAIADYQRSLQYLNQEENHVLGSENARIGKFVHTWLEAIFAPLTA